VASRRNPANTNRSAEHHRRRFDNKRLNRSDGLGVAAAVQFTVMAAVFGRKPSRTGALPFIAITRLEDGLFLDVNETWQAMTGYSRDEAIGRTSCAHCAACGGTRQGFPPARAKTARGLD